MSRSDDAAAVVAPYEDVDVVAAAVGVVAGSRKLDQQPEAKRSDD